MVDLPRPAQVVDPAGKVARVYPEVSPKSHPDQVLADRGVLRAQTRICTTLFTDIEIPIDLLPSLFGDAIGDAPADRLRLAIQRRNPAR